MGKGVLPDGNAKERGRALIVYKVIVVAADVMPCRTGGFLSADARGEP